MSKANAKIEELVFSFTFCLDYFEALSVCVSPQKSKKVLHQVVTPKYLFEAVIIIFPIKKCVFQW